MPHRVEDGGAGDNKKSLAHLYELARLNAQRPGNTGAGLKVIEALMNTGFKPNGGQA